MKTLSFLLFFYAELISAQATYFNIQYSHERYWDAALDIMETPGGYVAVGGYGAPWADDSTYLLRISKQDGSAQEFLQTDFYGVDAKAIQMSADSQYLYLLGHHFDVAETSENIGVFVKKLNASTLETVDVRTYDIPQDAEYFSKMIRLQNGGLAAVGYDYAVGATIDKAILFICDSNLNQVCLKTYTKNNSGNHFAAGLAETSDHGLIIVGNRFEYVNGVFHSVATFFRVDSLGKKLWWKEITPQGVEEQLYPLNIIRKDDGNYLVVGCKYFHPIGPDYQHFWVFCINDQGDVLWSREHGENDWTGWGSIARCRDGNYVLAGYEKEKPITPYRQYGVISKITPDGDLIWHRKYTFSTEDQHYEVLYGLSPTSDGGFICAGTVWTDSISREDTWIIKVDSFGCLEPGCNGTVGVIELPAGAAGPVTISPNPNTGLFTIETKSKHSIEQLRIYAPRAVLIPAIYTQQGSQVTVDISTALPGVYFCTLLLDGVWITRQLIKM